MDMRYIRASVIQFMGNFVDALKFQHHDTNAGEHEDIDVEMNVLGAHAVDFDPGDNDQANHPAILSRVLAFLSYTAYRFRRFWVTSGINDAASNITEFQYNACITFFVFVCCLVWSKAGYPAAEYVFPFHKTTGELWKDNYHRLSGMWPGFHVAHSNTTTSSVQPSKSHHTHEFTQTFLVDEDEDKTFVLVKSTITHSLTVTTTEATGTFTHVPGFYFVPTTSAVSDNIWKVTTPTPSSKTARATDKPKRSPTDDGLQIIHVTPKDDVETVSDSGRHHALDAHDGGFVQFKDGFYVKPPLKECAYKLLEKLVDHGMTQSEALELALRNCKNGYTDTLKDSDTTPSTASTIHEAVRHDQIKRDLELKSISPSRAALDEACKLYNGPPISNPTKWTATKCAWKFTPGFRNRICSDTFCDRFVGSRFHRCYRTSNISTAECRDKFTLEDANDYRNDAAYECEFCLPSIDCAGIEIHCQKVQDSEAYMTKLLVLCFAVPVVLLTGAIWAKFFIRSREKNLIPAARQEEGFDDEDVDVNEQRTSVTPAANDDQYPGIVRRHGSTESQG